MKEPITTGRHIWRVVVAVLSLVLAACSSGGGSGTTATTEPQGTGPASGPTTTLPTATTTAVPFPTEDIEVIVPFPGGNFELQTRAFAPIFQSYLPTEVVVGAVNVEGGGGIIGYNQAWEGTPGYTLAVEGPIGNAIRKLSNPGNAQWETDEWNWLGGWFIDTPGVGVRAGLGPTTWEEFVTYGQENQIVWGTPSVGSLNHAQMQVLSNVLGLDVRFVHYGSTGDVRTALARGEVDAYVAPASTIGEFAEDGEADWIGILSLEAHPFFADVPTLEPLINADLIDDAGVQTVLNLAGEARGWMTPPGLADEHLGILREAFWQSTQDPQWTSFLEDAGVLPEPTRGEDMDTQVEAFWPEFQEVWEQLEVGE